MRFRTIWTLAGAPLSEKLNRTGEELLRRLAHRLPRKLAYLSFIDSGARYIKTDEVVPEVTYFDILSRFEKKEL